MVPQVLGTTADILGIGAYLSQGITRPQSNHIYWLDLIGGYTWLERFYSVYDTAN